VIVFTGNFEEIHSFTRSQITLRNLGGKHNGILEMAIVSLSIVTIKLVPHGSSQQIFWLYLKVI